MTTQLQLERRSSLAGWRSGVKLEIVAAFLVGLCVMNFIYLDARGFTDFRVGLPGFDAFYHVKMALLLPEIGLPQEFPWLQHVYFTREGHEFVSHHVGFHVLLMPFVYAGQWLVDDPMAGGRWAIATFFGVCVALFYALLARADVRGRWAWLMLFLLLPGDFFLRQSYIRAISPSLMFQLALLLLLFERRFILAAICVALYNHLYLGAVIFSPIIVGTFVAVSLLGPREDRRIEWQAALFTGAGWIFGVLTYPYRRGMLEFLELQVFGSGLNPDIEVGMEWYSYDNVWNFVQEAGWLWIIWIAVLCLRLRRGPALRASEMTLVALQFIFLALTVKARRFIEYWPPYLLLSSAYLAQPILADAFEQCRVFLRSRRSARLGTSLAAVGATAVPIAAVVLLSQRGLDMQNTPLFDEWPLALVLGGVALLAALPGASWARSADGGRFWRPWAVSGASLLVFAGVSAAVLASRSALSMKARLGVGPLAAAIALIAAWAIIPLLAGRARIRAVTVSNGSSGEAGSPGSVGGSRMSWVIRPLSLGVAASGLLILTMTVAGDALVRAERKSYCQYDLPAIRNAMEHLKKVSEPGDVVFTDDWDIFPVYFLFNSHNHYIVGLDPKFTQSREPELWTRYVMITRGEAPGQGSVKRFSEDGALRYDNIQVRIEDIRDSFKAKWVIVDQDHQALARQLAGRPDFAELAFPSSDYKSAKQAPYLIFRILQADEAPESPLGRRIRQAKGDAHSDVRPVGKNVADHHAASMHLGGALDAGEPDPAP